MISYTPNKLVVASNKDNNQGKQFEIRYSLFRCTCRSKKVSFRIQFNTSCTRIPDCNHWFSQEHTCRLLKQGQDHKNDSGCDINCIQPDTVDSPAGIRRERGQITASLTWWIFTNHKTFLLCKNLNFRDFSSEVIEERCGEGGGVLYLHIGSDSVRCLRVINKFGVIVTLTNVDSCLFVPPGIIASQINGC